jgi:phage tail protein X
MRFIRYKRETSVDAIVTGVYAELSAAQRKKAADAFLRANPQLATLGNVRPGTILTVPDLPGIRPAPSRSTESPSDEIAEYLIEALQEHRKKLRDRYDILQGDIEDQRSLLKDRSLGTAISGSDAAQKLRESANKALVDESKTAAESRKRLEAALSALTKELAKR